MSRLVLLVSRSIALLLFQSDEFYKLSSSWLIYFIVDKKNDITHRI